MDDLWAPPPEEPDFLRTSPMESSHPSFPFVDREVEPLDLAHSSAPLIPPPPPPPMIAGNDEQTKPIIVGITGGTALGMIMGAALSLCAFAVILGIVLTHLGLIGGPRNSTSAHTAGRSSSASYGTTPGSSGGTAIPIGNVGKGTPVPTGAPPHPGGTVSPTGTAAPSTATPAILTATPAPLPLMVNGSAQDHQSLTMNIQTKPGATLTITLTYCNGSTDAKYNDFTVVTASGTYTDTISGTPKCRGGVAEGTLAVQAHLSGYQDASEVISIPQGP